MSVTTRDVRYVADLARLELSAEEVEGMVRDLNAILEHADTLAAADDESAPPYDVEPDGAALREPGQLPPDAVRVPPEALAPSWTEGFFTVPRLAALDDS